MIGALLALVVATSAPPTHLQVVSARGVVSIALVQQRGDGPLVPLNALARALGATVEHDDTWVTLSTPAGRFRFLAGTPLVQDGVTMRGLPGASRRLGDSLYVPLAFVADVLADSARRAWHWTAASAVLSEGAGPGQLTVPRSRTTVGNAQRTHLPGGLRPGHRVTIDPGHGGVDPGAPGVFFPRGMHEKDVTLAVGLLVAAELEKKGVRVTMTRTRDTLINLGQRAPRYCQADCDLFVSIHVNSLERRPGYTAVRGFETYFLSEARSADAERVARMENGAVRYDSPPTQAERTSGLDFMFKDLQRGEFLRESQHAASLIQSMLGEVHDGPNHGVKQAGFAVLSTARRPSVLIEMGYSTNRDDAELMTTPRGQRDLAAAIARAIVEYLRHFDQETTDTSSGSPQ
ncbi:MAG: N-acetylmuramoyl-L-alanine amidase [Gemmatimonadales bacterium]